MTQDQFAQLTELMISWTNSTKSTLGMWIEDLCIFELLGIKKHETRKEILYKCKEEI